jgi:hypothetical protein
MPPPVAVLIVLWAQRQKRRDTTAVNMALATKIKMEEGPEFETQRLTDAAGAMASGNPAYK